MLSVSLIPKSITISATVWGTLLLKSRHCGAVRLSGAQDRHSVAPSADGVIQAMDEDLLVGVFSDGLEKESGYLMVVDLRTNLTTGSTSPRLATVTINTACQAAVVPGHQQGWAQPSSVDKQHVTLSLHGGGGALLRVTGGGTDANCGQLLRGVRQWFFPPRRINLKHSYPETSLKAATYGGSKWMPQGFTKDMKRDATGQGYGRGWCNQRERRGFESASICLRVQSG